MSDLTHLQYLLLLVGIPLVVAGIVILAVMGPGWTRAGAYRPGEAWDYEPIVITGNPSGNVAAALTAVPSDYELLGAVDLVDAPANKGGEGGASARW